MLAMDKHAATMDSQWRRKASQSVGEGAGGSLLSGRPRIHHSLLPLGGLSSARESLGPHPQLSDQRMRLQLHHHVRHCKYPRIRRCSPRHVPRGLACARNWAQCSDAHAVNAMSDSRRTPGTVQLYISALQQSPHADPSSYTPPAVTSKSKSSADGLPE